MASLKDSTLYVGLLPLSLGVFVPANDDSIETTCTVCNAHLVGQRSIVSYILNATVTIDCIYEKSALALVCLPCMAHYLGPVIDTVIIPFKALLPIEAFFKKHVPAAQSYENARNFFDTWRKWVDKDRDKVLAIAGKCKNMCKECGAKDVKHRCAHCHINRYCDEVCSHADWKEHAFICKRMTAVKDFVMAVIVVEPVKSL